MHPHTNRTFGKDAPQHTRIRARVVREPTGKWSEEGVATVRTIPELSSEIGNGQGYARGAGGAEIHEEKERRAALLCGIFMPRRMGKAAGNQITRMISGRMPCRRRHWGGFCMVGGGSEAEGRRAVAWAAAEGTKRTSKLPATCVRNGDLWKLRTRYRDCTQRHLRLARARPARRRSSFTRCAFQSNGEACSGRLERSFAGRTRPSAGSG